MTCWDAGNDTSTLYVIPAKLSLALRKRESNSYKYFILGRFGSKIIRAAYFRYD